MSYKENNKYISSKKENNSYAEEWGKIEKIKKIPSVYRKTKLVEHKEFMAKIMEQNPIFVKSVVESLYLGDIYIIKNALSKKKLIISLMKFTNLLNQVLQNFVRCLRVYLIFIGGSTKIL